ncbi:MAG: cytidine deaminase [Chitinophagaceae bacterium]|jgi:cytidine deaminase|nr:cytidine deaminase [Chitinophagaceae bacterium]
MKEEAYSFSLKVFDSIAELNGEDALLLNAAIIATAGSYSPYSQFRVAAAAMLQNGKIVTGTNQENASYPAGICAERVLLSAASSLFPNEAVSGIAITYLNEKGESNHPISPCGLCRQSLLEQERRQQCAIRLILGGAEGIVVVIEKASLLMPLAFTGDELQ